jgi:alpha-methylacyl-CoA racemase
MGGPLTGIRVVTLAGLGPIPFASMMLADLGADVVRVDRLPRGDDQSSAQPTFLTLRGQRSVAVDLKHPDGVAAVLRLVETADVFIEGFRPGVTERLGLGPTHCQAVNPRLVYGRGTGWGQDGPLAPRAGHDIDYIALTGALHAIGRRGDRPVPPLNLVGDSGGGGMFLAFGVVCALLEARASGHGQVVDAAMVDGAAVLTTVFHGLRARGLWSDERASNLIDTGSHFYEVYECADGKFVAVGAIEGQFYAQLVRLTGFEPPEGAHQLDQSSWPEGKRRMAEIFATKSRDAWCALFDGTDACVAPVLSWSEAIVHPHNVARRTFIDCEGVVQPAPAPRFSRTPASIGRPPAAVGEHTDDVLAEVGLSAPEIAALRHMCAVG